MNDENQPPVPGGDPAQPPPDLPVPTSEKHNDKVKDPAAYGRIADRDGPAPEGASEPHQIF